MKDKRLGALRAVVIGANRREASGKSAWRYELLRRMDGERYEYAVRMFDIQDAGRGLWVDPYWGTAQHAADALKLHTRP